jgi:energy-coupling factor transport system permease protein
LARRLLAGSLDRAVDVAATLELRGYGLNALPAARARSRSRYDARFYAVALALTAVAIGGKAVGAGGFHEYPAVTMDADSLTLAPAILVALSGLAPLRRKPRRLVPTPHPEAASA